MSLTNYVHMHCTFTHMYIHVHMASSINSFPYLLYAFMHAKFEMPGEDLGARLHILTHSYSLSLSLSLSLSVPLPPSHTHTHTHTHTSRCHSWSLSGWFGTCSSGVLCVFCYLVYQIATKEKENVENNSTGMQIQYHPKISLFHCLIT